MGLGNFLSAAKDVALRDTGHALNAANNIAQYGSLHAPSGAPLNSIGMGLINTARSDPNNPATVINAANNGYNVGGSTVNQGSAPKGSTVYTGWQAGGDQSGGTFNQTQYYDPSTGAYTGTAPGSGPTAADLAQYDLAIGQYENQLGAVDRQLGIAHGNIDSQFGQKSNELQSGYDQAHNQYNQNTTQNQQQFVSNKNQVRDSASAGLRGLLRTLGAYGGGGTDAEYARNIVAQNAARQNSGAGETFGQNQQGLDTSINTFNIQNDNQKKQLNDWHNQQLQSADQTGLSTKQSVLNTLAQLRSQRANGTSAEATAAMQQANALQPQIDQLGAFNPSYTGTTPTYTAPDVSSYTVNPNAQVQVAQNANDSLTSPWLAALLGKDKKQSLQPAF